MTCAVYILTNRSNRVLYTGVTSNLPGRLWKHRTKQDPGSFTARYNLTKLVYFELTNDMHAAISREKQIKNWRRAWKVALIEKSNPEWEDLSSDWL
jgi:putative endonuclease